jgi:hypothetical protein
LLASGVFLLAASSVWAEDRETQERTAQKACLLGDFKKGIEILADLYLDTHDPTYIYNHGRCLEQNGQNEPAILRFREYLRKAEGLSPADADAVRKRIDDLQPDRQGKPAPAEPAVVPTPVPETTTPPATAVGSTIPPSAAPVPTPEPLGLAQAAPNQEPPASPPVYKRWWFWTGVGVVVVGGVVTAIVLSSKSAAKSPGCDNEGTCVR